MELMERGGLRDCLEASKTNPNPNPQDSCCWQKGKLGYGRRIATDVARALKFLHSLKPQPIVHLDVKSDNVRMLLYSADACGVLC